MGISIEQYRACIGSFLPIRNSSTLNNMNHGSLLSQSKTYLTMLVRLLLLVSISHQFLCVETNYPQCVKKRLIDRSSSLQNIVCDVMVHSSFKMVTNFQSKYTYGNKRASGIRICHWNKGKGFLSNKLTEIKSIVKDINPHIIGISEANLYNGHDLNQVQLDDYDLHICPSIKIQLCKLPG